MRFSALCLLALTLFQSLEIMAQKHLRDYQWKQRILLLIAPDPEMAALNSQAELIRLNKTAFEERDVLIFVVSPEVVVGLDRATSRLDALAVYKDTGTKLTYSGVVLIGKDGGVKLRNDYWVAPQKIFDLIDGMPMRRAEISKNR
jgi:hypothetical protein